MRLILAFMLTLCAGLAAAQEGVMPPFYRGVEKGATLLAADAAFIQRALESHEGDAAAAAQTWVGMAWGEINIGDGESAVRRFNQAYLLDPANPGLAYGMMIATHLRGDEFAVVDGLYAEALAAMPEVDRHFAHIDYAQILVMRGEAERAVALIEPYKDDPRAAVILQHINESNPGAAE